MTQNLEHRALQIAVAVAGLVPVMAGAVGAFNPAWMALSGPASALTHAGYLSGLLLGLGLAFWSLIPSIEKQGRLFGLLAAIVMLGGVARLALALKLGVRDLSVLLPLVMELGVTPALWAWQRRIARASISAPE